MEQDDGLAAQIEALKHQLADIQKTVDSKFNSQAQQLSDLSTLIEQQTQRLQDLEIWVAQAMLHVPYGGGAPTARVTPTARAAPPVDTRGGGTSAATPPPAPGADAPAGPPTWLRTESAAPGFRPGTAANAASAPSPGSTGPVAGSRATRIAGTDLESLIGGSLLNRIGAVALVLGLGFFFKFAVDNGWITPGMRIAFGILLGLGLLGLGEATRRRRLIAYSHALSGTGFAVLYLSVYCAYGFYHLIGFGTAFGTLALVTAAAVIRAVTLEAEAIAALGVLLGFLTPVVLHGSAAGGAPTGIGPLFTYLWILDAGVLAAASFRDWKILKLCSLLFTQIFWIGWLSSEFHPELLHGVLVASTLFFLLFVGIAVVTGLSLRKPVDGAALFLILENPAAYAALLGFLCCSQWPQFVGFYLVLLAAGYALLCMASLHRAGWDAPLPISFLAVSVGFATLAICLLLTGEARLLGWAGEAVVLLWGGGIAPSRPLRTASYLCYALVGCSLFVSLADWAMAPGEWSLQSWLSSSWAPRPWTPQSGATFLLHVEMPFLICLLAALVGAWIVRCFRSRLLADEESVPSILAGSAAAIGLAWLSLEILFRVSWTPAPALLAWLSAGWALYACGLLALGIFGAGPVPRMACAWLARLLLVKLALFDTAMLLSQPEVHKLGGVLLTGIETPSALAVLALLTAEWQARRYRDRLEPDDLRLEIMTAAAAYIVGFLWLTTEALVRSQSGTNLSVPAWISATWSAYAAGLLTYGILRRRRLARIWGLGVLALVIFKVFASDIWSLAYVYRVLSLFTLAAALWGVSYLYSRYRDRISQLVLQD